MDNVPLHDGDVIVYRELTPHFIAFLEYGSGDNMHQPVQSLSSTPLTRNEQRPPKGWHTTFPSKTLFQERCRALAERSGLRMIELECGETDRGEVFCKVVVQKK